MDKKKVASGIGAALSMSNPLLAVGSGVLGALGSFFGGRRQSREAERDRELQRERLGLERSRFGLERQQYADEMAARRRLAEFARQNRAKLEGGGAFQYEMPKQRSYMDYANNERGSEDRARQMFTGRS